ncbi:protocatechuate 3,4-dioxygenase subunit beta [Roseomonas stagni]|uniref:Protocatechuate 3,4-dioxygenase subunit beta n=1 Tax=Falsiroseomonas algicola TaxID=2716930 RepID=A0A6M1LFT2_9PROT|nr:protocatechuate 3,4-dioxygenase subunit beta [Falsiroseomonas algicola]NGM19061.1 protocatechuate 3,4-dioxygenase subunit beta [Falsiroseomonas algicola]
MSDPIPYRRPDPATQPPYDAPSYGSTHKRHPKQALLRVPHTLTETSAPRFDQRFYATQADMSQVGGRGALGERIIVAGRVTDEDGRPCANTMVEVWQANASGRYHHPRDQHDAPLDPNFEGRARIFTDAEGRYSFTSIKPGAYPWRNHWNAWRPIHIHFGLHGAGWAQRMITQMYFPGDPLLALDPIFNTTADEAARNRLVSTFDLEITKPEWALGYRFDIVLRGRDATPFENA